MNRRPSTPDPTASADSTDSPAGPCGEGKAARQGVLPALPPDAPVTITGITPGLQIRTNGAPVADWLCTCGHHERARGRTAVAELVARAEPGTCLHRTHAPNERRNAA